MKNTEEAKRLILFFAKEFKKEKINWMLIGSGALVLHGVKVISRDLDIVVNSDDLDKVALKFSKNIVKPIIEYEWKGQKYRKFLMKIKEIEVEIIGQEVREKTILVGLGDEMIRVNPLDDELEFYKTREGKEGVVELIEKVLLQI